MTRIPVVVWLLVVLADSGLWAAEVSGRVEMPSSCSPAVSPAVIRLESLDGSPPAAEASPTAVALVNQKMLQFQPRVEAMALGQPLRFTNDDQEPHNVHVLAEGESFNQTIRPGETVEFTPRKAGLLRLVCDIHIHMRGFVVVSDTPWYAVCDRVGAFQIANVPEGRYRVHVWHELGDPLTRDIEVKAGRNDLGTLTLRGPAIERRTLTQAKVEPWPDVIDRISVKLSEAIDIASRKTAEGAASKAVSRVDDAYLAIFEGSDMETAVRSTLGFDRAFAIEEQFRTLRREARDVVEGKSSVTRMARSIRALLASLNQTARDLDAKGVSDRSKVLVGAAAVATAPPPPVAEGDQAAQLADLRRAFDRVAALAEQGRSEAAASELVSAYFEAFEPLERVLNVREPSAVRPLEMRFAATRGRIEAGLRGQELAASLDAITEETIAALRKAEGSAASAFGLGFAASLGTILREGVEVILLLTMLAALVAKAGRPRGAMAALWWGVGLAVLASLATALGLNLMVSASRGRGRELLEGMVMLLASAVLFYVSYWLISQSESKRWMAFLKRQAQQGAAIGGFFTLGLTAFLAVYREGAETALMYQAMLAGQPPQGVAGVVTGLAVGVVLLAIIAVILRVTSLKLPLRAFFQVTGILLFAMAVVFAGHGILELQVAGLLKSTPVTWLGRGLPVLGLHPSAQGLAVQGLLLLGAVLALVLMVAGRDALPATSGDQSAAGSPQVVQANAPSSEPLNVGA